MKIADPSTPSFRVSNPRLPFTVSMAAVELDRAARGESVNFEATKAFTEFLLHSFNQDVGGGGHVAWLDANTVDVVGDALIEFEGDLKVRTVADVLRHARDVIQSMERASEEGGNSHYSDLRRFCVAFGNSLLAHRSAWRHEGPVNPYRR